MGTERKPEAEKEKKEMRKWCVALSKVELHAHLNDSVRNSTLLFPKARPISNLTGALPNI